MSVLIKGVKMPRSCNECPMSVGGYCIMSPKPNGDALNRHETTLWCPLVEVPTPHGRLIDAEKIANDINALKDNWNWYGNEYESGRYESYDYAVDMIEDAPAVIEAEE